MYEISNLVYGYINNKSIRRLFAFLDRKLISNSLVTVMTSKGFQDYLYPKDSPNQIIIQPNRVHNALASINRNSIGAVTHNLCFSFVGMFRYPNTVFRFAKVIGENFPQHTFCFYGDSPLTQQVKNLVAKYRNVIYYGTFVNPKDLPRIYSTIDIIVACYDTKSLNEIIAEPNKLYEALFFKKPIIVSKNTFLEKQVLNKYKCGFAIDATSDSEIIDLVSSLNFVSIKSIISKIDEVDLENIIDDESFEIIQFIKNNFPQP